MIGATLSHYRITGTLGAGGMGVVYRAEDMRLGREVAVKVLPGEVAGDPDRLARFEREARALARMTHPNLLTIHEFGEDRGIAFAVTELLEGETLRERLRGGPLPWQEVLEVGAAIAEGLGAAHAQGVVHRDLKPENVFITGDGRVKVLDFGLAKVREGATHEAETITSPAGITAIGAVMGTAGYMAPEQVLGDPVDHRCDVFASGCVLYELFTGSRAFCGTTGAEVLSAILNGIPPPVHEVVPGVPAALSRVVERCLEKSPERRFQSAKDLAFALRSSGARASGASAGATGGGGPTPAADRPFIAVLPFANLSAEPAQDYFCDGISEEIINALARVQGLRVVARTSAFEFKGKNEDIREIGRKLGVGAIVEGSVRRAGDRLRISAQLIDVADGSHLWSERFDRRLEDVFEIQDEISLAIVEKLEVRLLGAERSAVVKRPTTSLDAYDAYLKAWFHWNELTPEGFLRSRECLERSIAIDPCFARAHAGLAVWYLSQSWWGELSPEDGMAAALPLVLRALELDDTTAEAYAFLGVARGCFERDRAAGEDALRRAVELAPNAVETHGQLGAILLLSGRFEEALAEVRLAHTLDPLSPTWSSWTCSWAGLAGDLDEGIACLERVVVRHPHHWIPRHELANLYGLASRLEEARSAAEKAADLSGGLSATVAQLAGLSYLLADTGRGDELFERLLERERVTYVPPSFLALIHLARGEVGLALERLRQAARGKDPWLAFHRLLSPTYHAGDPCIDALLEEIGV